MFKKGLKLNLALIVTGLLFFSYVGSLYSLPVYKETLRVPSGQADTYGRFGRLAELVRKADSLRGAEIPRRIRDLLPDIEPIINLILKSNNLIPNDVLSTKSVKVEYEDEYYDDVGYRISIHLRCLDKNNKEVVLKCYFSTLGGFAGDSPENIIVNTEKSHRHFPKFFKIGKIEHKDFIIYYQIYEYIKGNQAPKSLKEMDDLQKIAVVSNLIASIEEGYFDLGIVLWDLGFSQFVINEQDAVWKYIDVEQFPHSDQLATQMAYMFEKLNRMIRYLPTKDFRDFKRIVKSISERLDEIRPMDYSKEQANKDIIELINSWSESVGFSPTRKIPSKAIRLGL
jgi:hypothetical protein